MNTCRSIAFALMLSLACSCLSAFGEDGPAKTAVKQLLDMKPAAGFEKRLTPQSGAENQISAVRSSDAAAPGLVLTIQPGKADYPGVGIKPEAGDAWDLSAFGHVEARVVNTGATVALLAMRVDNKGDWRDNPWSTEQLWLKPGEAGTLKVIFGYSYGQKPSYRLNPKEVVNILLFTDKADAAKSFRIESLVASGPAGEKPPVDPNSVRLKPANGVILGSGAKMDAAAQIETNSGVKATLAAVANGAPSLLVEFPAAQGDPSATFKPAMGRWDLTRATQVRVVLRNEGKAPLTPQIQVLSNGGPTALVSAKAPLAAGAKEEIVVPFAALVPGKGVAISKPGYYGNQSGTGTSFASDATSGVKITAKHDGEAALRVESITAEAPPAQIPEWLGKRPPLENDKAAGDWVKTFDEAFDGPAMDSSKWNIYGPNYWDRSSHWSKDNLILDGGLAKFHFEKKRGFHNDDPNPKELQNLTGLKESDYACGYLDTYGKWVQRYGYFETRVKLPTAPGLWPTFWLMPDRGAAAGPQGNRSDTGNGGMEFDILEHLTRWGPYRYNVALHWDGYGKEHTSVGSATNYIQADKDGYITCGLLWTPGVAAFYGNGKELWRWEGARVSQLPCYIIIEMTTGGWDNNAVDDSQLPADYLLDYVRVWQRKDLKSAADGIQPAPKPGAK